MNAGSAAKAATGAIRIKNNVAARMAISFVQVWGRDADAGKSFACAPRRIFAAATSQLITMAQFYSAHDDKAVAARILAGDEVAFRRLFDELFPKLYRFAMLRLDGNRDDVCEVVQQTYCRAFEQLAHYRGEASLVRLDVPDLPQRDRGPRAVIASAW